MPSNIPFYSGLDETDRARLLGDVQNTYEKVAAAVVSTTEEEDDDTIPAPPTTPEAIEIPESADLIGIDPAVYRQIQAALRAGKQHLMFYGPPGTGKTSLARNIAAVLHTNWRLITGSADWTSQDVIGGYQPVGDGKIALIRS